MKKILISFLSLIMVLGIGLGISQLAEQKKAGAELTSSEDFVMTNGAQFRSYWTTTNCGITYMATIPYGHKYIQNIRLFIAPYDYVESIRGNRTGEIDYVTEFNNAQKQYLNIDPARMPSLNETYFTGGVKNIPVGQESRKYFGIYYYNDGTKNVYAKMPNGELGQARSIAYLSSGYYNDPSCTSDNDRYMTSYFMDRAIKTAVSKSNKTIDTSTINYLYNQERNTSVYSGQINATYLDDYITDKTTSVKVGNTIVNVGQRLDFKMDYSPYTQVINQNGKSGQFVNILKAGQETQSVKVGLDNASFSVNIDKFNLSSAVLTSEDKTFTDTLVADGASLIDSYNTTDITPSIVLTVPKANNMLSDKVYDNNNISSIGTLSFTISNNGANGDLVDASTDIVSSIYTTISGGNFVSSKQVTTTATKDKFDLNVAYVYGTNYENKAVGSSITTGITDKKYYYNQTYNIVSPSVRGYIPESNVEGIIKASPQNKTVIYNPEQYDCYINYKYSTSNNYEGKGGTTYSTYTGPNSNSKVYYMQTIPAQSSPAITGYTADITSFEQTRATSDYIKTVVYATNQYDCYINYKYSTSNNYEGKGGTTYSTYTGPNANSKVYYMQTIPTQSSPVITGYTADITSFEQTSATGNFAKTVTYSPKDCTLTISYTTQDGQSVPASQSTTVKYGQTATITNPNRDSYGYETTSYTYSYRMLTEGKSDTVNYTLKSYNVIYNYYYYDKYNTNNNSTASNGVTKTYTYKSTYNYTLPSIVGYSSYLNQGRVNAVSVSNTRTMPLGGETVSVYYSPNTYNVVVNYTGATANPNAKTLSVKYDYPYSISSPIVNSFRTSTSNVNGIMNNINGITHTVTYTQVHTAGWIVPFDTVGNFNANDSRELWIAKFKDIGDTGGANPTTKVGVNQNTQEFKNYGRNLDMSYDHTGNGAIHNNYSCYYLVWDDYSNFVTSKNVCFYFEFEFMVTGRTDANASSFNFGIMLENVNNQIGGETRSDFITLDCKNATSGSGAYDKEIVVYNKYNNNWNTRGSFTYLPNYTKEFVKCAMWLDANGVVTISFNNIKAFSYTTNVLSNSNMGKICYIGLQGWNVAYQIRNALYSQSAGVTYGMGLNDAQRLNVTTPSANYKNGEYHSNTISATDFYYETYITPTGFSSTATLQGKVGIMLTSCANKNNQLFFFVNLWERKERQELGKMISTDGNWEAGSTADNKGQVMNIAENTFGVRRRYAIWKNGASIYFIFNENAYLMEYDERFAGPCTISLKTLNVVFDFDTSAQVAQGADTNSEGLLDYNKIAQERGLDEIVLDGYANDDAWSINGRNRTIEKYETDGSGRYFKFKAFLGRAYIYVAAEVKLNNITKTDVAQDSGAVLSSNLQVDFRGTTAVARTTITGKYIHHGFAHVTFVEKGDGLIYVEAAIPYVIYTKQANSTALTSLVARISFGACEKSTVLGWVGDDKYTEADRYKWWCDLYYYTVTGSGINLETKS